MVEDSIKIVAQHDPQIARVLSLELKRQRENLELRFSVQSSPTSSPTAAPRPTAPSIWPCARPATPSWAWISPPAAI